MARGDVTDTIHHLEEFAQRDPRGYRRRLARQVALGYAPLALSVGAMVGVLGWVFTEAVLAGRYGRSGLILCGLLLGLLIRRVHALWLSLPYTGGTALDAATAPGLFAQLESLRRTLRAPAIERVWLVEGTGFEAVSLPRWGLFGLRHELVIGRATLLALSPEQAEVLLARELAWLTACEPLVRHAHWLVLAWSRAVDAKRAQQVVGESRLERYAEWCLPPLRLLALVLQRAAEDEADRRAAAHVGTDALVDAVVAHAVAMERLQRELSPALRRRAYVEAEPPTVSTELSALFGTRGAAALRALEVVLLVPDEPTALRPSLAKRLDALGVRSATLSSPAVPEVTASRAWLGANETALAWQFDVAAREAMELEWTARQAWARRAREKLEQLANASTEPTPDEVLERAQLLRRLEGELAAEPLARQAVATRPGHAASNLLLGEILLAQGDEDGVACAERAMTLDEETTLAACAALYDWALMCGRGAQAAQYRERFLERESLLARARIERSTFTPETQLLPPELPLPTLRGLCRLLADDPEIRDAWIARREVQLMPERPSYVLLVVPRRRWLRRGAQARHARLADRLTAMLPELELDLQLLVMPRPPAWLHRKVALAAGGRLPLDEVRARLEGTEAWETSPEAEAVLLSPRPARVPMVRPWFVYGAVALLLVAGLLYDSGRPRTRQRMLQVLAQRAEQMETARFEPVERRGTVTRVRGGGALAVGTQCTVRITHVESERYNCRVQVECEGGQTLYGGPREGFNHCLVENQVPQRAFDPFGVLADGDPAMDLDLRRGRLTLDAGRHGAGNLSVTVGLEEGR